MRVCSGRLKKGGLIGVGQVQKGGSLPRHIHDQPVGVYSGRLKKGGLIGVGQVQKGGSLPRHIPVM